MDHSSSRAGKAVTDISLSDVSHEEYFVSGRPVLKQTIKGQIVGKRVITETKVCEQCERVAVFDADEDAVCPCCGRLFNRSDRTVRDFFAAERAQTEATDG